MQNAVVLELLDESIHADGFPLLVKYDLEWSLELNTFDHDHLSLFMLHA
jgi:hypothetical protein